MSQSVVTCYVDSLSNRWKLQEERNFIIDDLEEYLSTKESYVIENVMYQKLSLTLEIKLAFNQLYAHPAYNSAIRYIKIEDDNYAFPYYYYVEECTWLSESAVRLSLHMDTLNTFKFNDLEKGYGVSNETHIVRQFRDRYEIHYKETTYDTILEFSYSAITSTMKEQVQGMLDNYTRFTGSDNYSFTNLALPIIALSVDGVDAGISDGSLNISVEKTTTTTTTYSKLYLGGESTRSESATPPLPQTGTFTFTELNGVSVSGTIVATQESFEATGQRVHYVYSLTITFTSPIDSSVMSTISSTLGNGITTNNFSTSASFSSREWTQASSTTEVEFILYSYSISITFNGEVPSISTTNSLSMSVKFTTDEATWVASYEIPNGYTLSTQGDVHIFSPYYYKKIDWFPEEINPPLYKRSEQDIIDSTNDNSWFLITRNQTDTTETSNHPVILDLCADGNIQYLYMEGGQITGSEYRVDYYLLKNILKVNRIIIGSNSYNNAYISFLKSVYTNDSNDTLYDVWTDYQDETINYWVSVEAVTPSSIKCIFLRTYKRNGSTYMSSGSATLDYLRWNTDDSLPYSDKSATINIFDNILNGNTKTWSSGNFSNTSGHYVITSTTTTQTYKNLSSITDIDRTNTQLIKIVETPYNFMGDVYDENGNISFPINMGIDEVTLGDNKYTLIKVDNQADLRSDITSLTPNPLLNCVFGESVPFEPTALFNIESELSETLETKLLHSEFYYQKVVYDSFSFIFPLENILMPENFADIPDTLNFTFVMTGTTSSTFLFMFDVDWKYTQEDYDNIMVVDRNNEIPIYSSDYITYMNTGYNYDVKNKNLKVAQSWINSALGIGSGVAGVLTGSRRTRARGIVSTSSNGAEGIVGSAFNQAIMENNINKKILQYEYNPTSVYSSDDVDLLNYYSHNRAKLVTYSVSDEYKKLLLALFHYTGYKCSEYGVPDVTTRTRFNYVEAELVFNSVLNFSIDLKNDIINKWREGVYFIHHYLDMWDDELKYENYESSLVKGD